MLGGLYYQATRPITPMNDPDCEYMDTNDKRRMEVFQYGDVGNTSAHVVLFLHGAFMTGKFCENYDTFGKEHNVWFICPTLPGWGTSVPITRRGSLLLHTANDLESIIQQMNLRRVNIVAYSLGATYAISTAVISPRISSINLLSSVFPIVTNEDLHDPFSKDPSAVILHTLVQPYIRDLFGYGIVLLGHPSGIDILFNEFLETYPELAEKYFKHDSLRSVKWYHQGVIGYYKLLKEEGNTAMDQLNNMKKKEIPIRLWHSIDDEVASVTNSQFIISQLGKDHCEFFSLKGDHLMVLGLVEEIIQDHILE